MRDPSISIQRIAPALGGEVRGVDLEQPLNSAQCGALHAAIGEHLVLVFPDQTITTAQFIAFAASWGELAIHPNLIATDLHPALIAIERRPGDPDDG